MLMWKVHLLLLINNKLLEKWVDCLLSDYSLLWNSLGNITERFINYWDKSSTSRKSKYFLWSKTAYLMLPPSIWLLQTHFDINFTGFIIYLRSRTKTNVIRQKDTEEKCNFLEMVSSSLPFRFLFHLILKEIWYV